MAKDVGKSQDEAEQAIFAAVGRAVSAWSHLEEALCWIFVLGVLPTPDDALQHAAHAAASYWSTESFRAKVSLVDAAVTLRLRGNAALLDDWRIVCKRAREKALSRNDLAHGTIVNFGGPERTFWVPALHKQVHSADTDKLRQFSSDPIDLVAPKRLTAKEIGDRTRGYTEFTSRLNLFNDSFARALRA